MWRIHQQEKPESIKRSWWFPDYRTHRFSYERKKSTAGSGSVLSIPFWSVFIGSRIMPLLTHRFDFSPSLLEQHYHVNPFTSAERKRADQTTAVYHHKWAKPRLKCINSQKLKMPRKMLYWLEFCSGLNLYKSVGTLTTISCHSNSPSCNFKYREWHQPLGQIKCLRHLLAYKTTLK